MTRIYLRKLFIFFISLESFNVAAFIQNLIVYLVALIISIWIISSVLFLPSNSRVSMECFFFFLSYKTTKIFFVVNRFRNFILETFNYSCKNLYPIVKVTVFYLGEVDSGTTSESIIIGCWSWLSFYKTWEYNSIIWFYLRQVSVLLSDLKLLRFLRFKQSIVIYSASIKFRLSSKYS